MRCFEALLVLGLFFLAGNATAEQPQEMILTYQDNGSEVNLAVGQTVKLLLRHPGTTGYQWFTDGLDKSRFELVGEGVAFMRHYSPWMRADGKMPVGGGGILIWTFKAVAPGDADLKALLYRGWLGKETATQRVDIKFHIQDKIDPIKNYIVKSAEESEAAFPEYAINISREDIGKEISLLPDTMISLKLSVPDKPGTDWHIESIDASKLMISGVRPVFVPPTSAEAEGIKIKNWYFKTLLPGKTTMRLEARDGRSVIDNFEVKLNIIDEDDDERKLCRIPESGKTRFLTTENNDGEIQVGLGDEIRIEMKKSECKSSGWLVNKRYIVLERGSETVKPYDSDGVPSYYHSFRAIAPGEVILKYICRSSPKEGIDLFKIRVSVTE